MEETSLLNDSQLAGNIPILFSDGECQLCNFWLQFILKNERSPLLHFAYIKGDYAQAFLPQDLKSIDSLILAKNNALYSKSDAALAIIPYLKGRWQFIRIFYLIPAPWRNSLYDFIARNRMRWFGRRATCFFPTDAKLLLRFLDS